MNSGAWITLVATAALLALVSRGSRLGEWIFKPLASTGFVLSALQHGATTTRFGQAVLAALVLSWWGDVLLIPRAELSFLAGLGAFLLGHVGFAVAFVIRGVAWPVALGGLCLLAVPLWGVGRWLLPKVPAEMKLPVMAYMGVITVMVALSAGTYAAHGNAILPLGAVCFYLSDLSVARDRFVAPGFANKAWGWPLYFGAQLLAAYSLVAG
ncbi:MAG: lysoplasmalogenase [Myxococcales bacterium]|nr:lysoplasmalogenase [Myxococcales bacterium]